MVVGRELGFRCRHLRHQPFALRRERRRRRLGDRPRRLDLDRLGGRHARAVARLDDAAFGRLDARLQIGCDRLEPDALGLGRASPLHDRRRLDRGRGARTLCLGVCRTPGRERLLALREGRAALAERRCGRRTRGVDRGELTRHLAVGAREAAGLERPDLQVGGHPRALTFEPLAILVGGQDIESQALQALVGPLDLGLHALHLGAQGVERRLLGGENRLRARRTASELPQLARADQQGLLQRRLAAARHRTQRVHGLTRRRDHGDGMRRLAPDAERLVEIVRQEHLAQHGLGQRPVIGIDLDLLDQPPSRRDDHRRPPLRIVRDHRGAAGAFPAEPADRLDRPRRVGQHDLAESCAQHRRDGALEVRRHAQHRGQQRRALVVPTEQARDAPRAPLVPRLQLAQRLDPRAELGDPIARVGAGLRAPRLVGGERRRRLDQRTAPALHARALRLEPVQALPEGIPPALVLLEPHPELSLLALELSPLTLDLGAPAMQRLGQVLEARFLGTGTHDGVLRLLDALLERHAGAPERVEPRLASLALGLRLGLRARQTLERVVE